MGEGLRERLKLQYSIFPATSYYKYQKTIFFCKILNYLNIKPIIIKIMRKNKEKQRHVQFLLRRVLYSSVKLLTVGFILCASFFGTLQPVMAQNATKITGVVRDESGIALTGVGVIVKGTRTGTSTNLDGQFSIELPQKTGTLSFSYIGMNKKEVSFNGSGELIVELTSSGVNLDEVVAIGYGSVKKRDLTGAVVSMKSKDITIAPTSNVMEALQGKVSGMDIIKPSGKVGADVDILLRGSRSIYGSNTPLFIIDGIPGSYNQINPTDIESVDVLKDASSTAIYGSAGANGVIIITTRKGKEGKATVNFDTYYGFSGTPDYKHGMIGDEWTNYQKESYKYLNGQYPANMSSVITDPDKLAAYNAGKWIDWVDKVAGNTATSQKYNLSISGGNQKTRIYSSLSYEKEEGLLSNEKLNKYGLRMNIDQEIFSWAKAGFISNMTYSDYDAGVNNTFTRALSAYPLGDAYDEFGAIKHEYATNEYTPLGDMIKDQFVDNSRNMYVNSNAFLEITPLKGLSLKTVLSGTLSGGRRGQYWGAQANANRPTYAGTPHASITNSYGYEYTLENILSYKKIIMKDHELGVTVVSSWGKDQNESNMASGSGQNLDSWSYYRLMSATSQHIESAFSQTQKTGYAARFNYSYKSKYLINMSNRWDGVSWLSEGRKWDNFPAVAAAWRITEENFMKSTQNWLSNLKLRVGYGVTGNSGGVGAYSTTTQPYAYSASGISINGKIVPFSQYTGTYGNPGLGWEKSHNWNIGLDMGFLNNRITSTIDLYDTQTKGLLFKRTMPITSGVTGWGSPLSSWENIAATSNKGIDFNISTINIKTPDFTWKTDLTLTWSTEKIESLPSGDLIAENLFEGEAIHSIYGFKYIGIWGSDTPAETLAAYGVKPGWVKIETVPQNGDGGVHKYSDKDKQVLGHTNPDYIIGLNNTFNYKSFDLTVFVMARFGQTISSGLLGWYNAKSGISNNQIAGADYWTESNQGAYYPVPGSGSQQTTMSALIYRDGTFFKVKNITLGYTLPKYISQKALMEKCRFFATAYNPLLIVKDKQLKGTDPETNGSDSFPLYKQFFIGINITF